MTVKQQFGSTRNLTVKHFLPKIGSMVIGPHQDVRLDDFSMGFLLGLLIGEGHFGGDGRQAQITLRMHVRHEKLFRWLERTIPGGKLYGPYTHGGRTYFQWMIRGPYLRDTLAPLIAERIGSMDDYAASRFLAMCERYRIAVRPP